ncbi:ABC transporter ATP-binding protein/permease [Streptomyces sp. NBC_00250]|uniref:ABC transporter ATP-binding protein n=1 Tax=Streptomyces sp. NBC_00250 TaxID=2903641 RepID=UPI002E29573D|nr:ABC transporter ATP-binding protein [Streptomyces sp. NBC_00250]
MKSLADALRTMLVLAARTDPRRLAGSVLLLLTGLLATPAVALLLRAFTEAALAGPARTAVWLGLAIAGALVVELMMGHFAHLLYFELGELQEAALHEELLAVTNGTPGLEHLESPEFADAVTLVRDELANTRSALESTLQLGGLALQSLVTTVILGTLDPWLMLLPLAAVPPVLIGRRAQALVDRAREATAEHTRRGRHLVTLATSAESVKELRLYGAEREVTRRQTASWETVSAVLGRAQLRAAALRGCGQLVFGCAFGAAILVVVRQALDGRAGIGDVVLLIALAAQVGVQVANALGLLTLLHGAGRTLDRLDRLRTWPTGTARPAGSPLETGGAVVPGRLTEGIRLENVGFSYAGSGRPVLRGIDFTIPAGSTLALVGENGAGKSTLVKLLCGLYQPTEGRILVDGVDLRDLPPEEWTAKVAPLFQDFARLELLVRENIGIGAVGSIGDDETLGAAVDLAGARGTLGRVEGGLDGLLGRGYGDGVELSGGQWQSLGLARSLVRESPLLLMFDEPASALDATAEHAVFERFGDAALRARHGAGAVTLFVSHRFSTVRMAERIVVLGDGRVQESGSHEELMERRGVYAELFDLQARVYL